MDSITLYMLAICTKSALCYPLDPPADCTKDKGFCLGTPYFTMTKAECEAVIDSRARKDGPLVRASLSCFSEGEWIRRFPERPERPIGPIVR